MKLTVLVDNHVAVGGSLCGEHGVSYYIEEENKRILFDTGYSNIFLQNAHKLGINLEALSHIVLSHGHLDHTGGLSHLIRLYAEERSGKTKLQNPTLHACPEIFNAKQDKNSSNIGMVLDKSSMERYFDLKLSSEPVWITKNLVFLGRIERRFNFEKCSLGRICMEGEYQDDYLMDDTVLAYKSAEGLVLITGCSHAGICNIVEYAKAICNEEKIVDIVGGLHLLNPSADRLHNTLDYIKALRLEALHACHCTDLNSKIALSNVAPLKEIGVGIELDFPPSPD